jgi:hypothetical protein
MGRQCATGREESVAAAGLCGSHMDMSDLEFWAFLTVAVPGLFLTVAIT